MEKNNTALSKITTPIGFSDTTGMSVYQSYTAGSGFNYMVGMREMKDLLIVEQIAEGTACTFLCGIKIYHKETKAIIREIEVERNVHYTREKVMKLVHNSLIGILIESCRIENTEIDLDGAIAFLDEALERCYFESSRKTVLEWAKSVGII